MPYAQFVTDFGDQAVLLPVEGPGLGTGLLPAVFGRADLLVRRPEA